MNALWQDWAARFDALQQRERALIAAALIGGIILLVFNLFLAPAWQRVRQAERNAADGRAQIVVMQAQVAQLQEKARDPDAALRAELAALNDQIAALRGRMGTLEAALVPPQRMPRLLEEMIGRSPGLRLLSLKTLPAAALLDSSPKAEGTTEAAAASGGLFRHGVEIRLEGSYADLLAYLERLEAATPKLLWRSVALSAEKHPKLEMTIVVYTLSLDRTWLIL